MIHKIKNFIANALLKSISYVFQILFFLLILNIATLLVAFIFMFFLISFLIRYINQINGDSNVPIARAPGSEDKDFST